MGVAKLGYKKGMKFSPISNECSFICAESNSLFHIAKSREDF